MSYFNKVLKRIESSTIITNSDGIELNGISFRGKGKYHTETVCYFRQGSNEVEVPMSLEQVTVAERAFWIKFRALEGQKESKLLNNL